MKQAPPEKLAKPVSIVHYAYEKVSTHPGYRFSRTLENLRKVSKSIRSNRIYSVILATPSVAEIAE
jgi:hypothetical protein